MKPVNLNQLLFHPKSDSLSFFLPPGKDLKDSGELDIFLTDMQLQLRIQEKTELEKKLDLSRGQIKKIFKSHPDRSHGFFLSRDLEGYIVLEEKVETYSIIGQTFHVRPILEEVFINPEFLLVNISLYDVKVFQGDFQHLEVIQQYEFDQLPPDFADSSRLYAPKHLGLIPYKSILALKTIAQKVKDFTLYQSLPVVITGLDEMKEIFLRYFGDSAGIYGHFQEDFFEKTCSEILEKSKKFKPAITDYYSSQLKERIKRMMKSRRILTDLSEIIKATYEGKVIHLVLPVEQKVWGKINPETGEFHIHKKAGKTSVDILNEIAEEVMRQGGKIQIMKPHFFPRDSVVLAVIKGHI
ncbi:MAG: hypothetical protein ACLGHN_00830 [Bacteriovoracia bacterium]